MAMPGPIESMAEYLVKIGWDTDELGFNKAIDKVKSFETGFIKSIANISSAIVELVSETAKIDLATERMARQYWISEQAARSLSTSLDALGMNYEDLFYATDEQYDRFLKLNNYAKQLEKSTSSDVDKTLVQVRDIQYEFSKMKVWFTYFTREVVYQISRYVDLDKIRSDLKYVNDILMKNLPKIAEWVGKIFSWVWQLGSTGLKVIYTLLKGIFDILGFDGVAAIGLIGGAIKLLKSGPLGWLIFGLTNLFLLIEDFMTWKAGGKSAFASLWEEIGQEGGLLDTTKKSVGDLLQAFKDLLDTILGLFNIESGFDAFKIIIKTGLNIIEGAARLAASALGLVIDAINILTGDFSIEDSEFIKNIKEFANWLADTSLFRWISNISDRVGAWLGKKFGTAWIDSQGMVHEYDEEGNEKPTYKYEEQNWQQYQSTERDKAYSVFEQYMKDKPTGYDPYSDPASPFYQSQWNRTDDPLLKEAIGNSTTTTTTTQTNNFNISVNAPSGNASDIARTTRDTINDMTTNRNWRVPIQG